MYAFPRKTPLGVVGEEGRRSAGIRELLKSTRDFAKQLELLEAGIIASSISLSINMSNRTPYFLHIPRLYGECQSSKCHKWRPEELPKKALQSCTTPAKWIVCTPRVEDPFAGFPDESSTLRTSPSSRVGYALT
jgi:hypothetical protein